MHIKFIIQEKTTSEKICKSKLGLIILDIENEFDIVYEKM